MLVFEELIKRRYAVWIDETKTGVIITSRTIDEWAAIFYNYATKYELFDTLYTLFELRKGDIASEQLFQDLNPNLCFKAFTSLQNNNKVKLYQGSKGLDDIGVKFIRA